jgi:TPR repeat protein
MYENGYGVIKNIVFAHMWYSIANSQGHKTAKKNLKIVEKKMTVPQIEESQILAKQCINNNYKGCS